jgi:outer membrane protein, heavy metal efflux system
MQRTMLKIVAVLACVLPQRAAAAQDAAAQGVAAQEAPAAGTLTLDQALAAAFERSPELRARRAEVAEARGRLLAARTYPFNPEVALSGATRDAPDGNSRDRAVELAQEIEVGGQRGRRSTVAERSLAAAESRFARASRVLAADVGLAFADATRARELVRIEEVDAQLAEGLLGLEERRLEAGASTQIDLNLAQAAAARSAGRLELARGEYLAARSELARVAGLDPSAPPVPEGELSTGGDQEPPLSNLVAAALAVREDLAALRSEEEAARARVDLERALALPNLVATAFREREADSEDIAGLGLAVGIPLFNRNRGAVVEARAAAERAAADTALATLRVQQEVTAAHATFTASKAASEALRGRLVGNLEENLALLQRAFEEGKIGRSELILFRRELLDSQREYLDALAAAAAARLRLDLATARLPVPSTSSTGSSQP